MLKSHDYILGGVCRRCGHDTFSSGPEVCDDNPKMILGAHDWIPNPDYVPPAEEDLGAGI